jgi:hypothetical protein
MKGKDIIVDEDHEVLQCPAFPSRILSVPSRELQLEKRHSPKHKTSIKSTGCLGWIRTNQNQLKLTIAHHDNKGIQEV